MADSKSPVNNNGDPITISFGHMGSNTRIILIVALALGIGNGSLQLVGRAQTRVIDPTTELRLSRVEEESVKCSVTLDVLDKKIDVLTQIAAASYVAATVDDPQRHEAARIAADRIKKENGQLLKSRDPLKLLRPRP